MNAREIFAKRLKAIRKARNLKTLDVAEAVGATRASICMYEEGKRAPNFDILVSISKYLEVTTDWLLGISEVEGTSAKDFGGYAMVEHSAELALKEIRQIAKAVERSEGAMLAWSELIDGLKA